MARATPMLSSGMTKGQAADPLDMYHPAAQDMRTLIEANRIKGDKPRHRAAKAHAKRLLEHVRAGLIEGSPEEEAAESPSERARERREGLNESSEMSGSSNRRGMGRASRGD